MKKSIFLFFAAILCATNAWAWCGNSFITVNGLWCTGSNSFVHEGGNFHGKDLGTLTTFELGGEFQVWPSSTTAGTLCYKIDDGTENSISLPKTGTEGNNSKHSGSGAVDLSGLAGGSHSIAVWFKHGSDIDNNGGSNFVATFTIAAATPDPEPEPEPVADVTVHFINSVEWAEVACHHWIPNGAGTSWPGDVLSKTDEIAGYDVYTATFTGEHTSCIFNNNNNGNKTGDLTVNDGKYYEVNTNTWYDDKAAAEAALATPIPDETVYFINTGNWSKVMIYTWNGVGGTTWPGVEMTPTGETIEGYDVYSYTAKQGGQANLLFQESADVNKTGDLEWEAGKYYAPSKDTWYDTKEDAAEALAIPLADETVYFVNNKQWASVAIYGWGGTASTSEGIGKWAGADMTKTAEQVAGFDVYSYTAKEGTVKNILFNYNGDENKTSDFVWTNGKYYYMDEGAQKDKNFAGGTKDEVDAILSAPVVDNYYVSGTFNGWASNDDAKLTLDGELYTKELTLDVGTHMFKVQKNNWAGEWGYSHVEGYYVGMEEGTNDDGDKNNNIKLTLNAQTTFTVKFNLANNEITFEGLTEDVTETLVYYVEVPAGTEDCYIAGQMNDWEFERMTQVDATHWTITYDNVLKTTEYKYACKPNWDYAEVRDGNRTEWQELDEVSEWNKPIYTVVGSNTNAFGAEWDLENYDNNMNLQDDGTYVWSKPAVSLSAGTEIELKVVKNKNWETAWPSDNYVLNITETAYYQLIVYYNPANNDVTVVKNKLEPEEGTLTINGVMLEEMGEDILAISGASSDWKSEVYMFLNGYTGENKTYEVNTESSVTYNESSSMYPNGVSGQLTQSTGADGLRTFTGVLNVVCEVYDEESGLIVGKLYELTTTLVEKSDEATVVVVENATLELTGDFLFMEGTWTDGDDTTYPVTAELPGFDPSIASADYPTTVTVGGSGADDPWLGFAEGTVTVTVNNGLVTLTGVLENAWTGFKLDITMSGEFPTYTRDVTNTFGTICLPYTSISTSGATFYEVCGKEAGKVYLVNVTTLEAGLPYVFEATASQIKVVYDKNTEVVTAGTNGALIGTFDNGTVVEAGYYILYNNEFRPSDGEAKINANRAYLDMSQVSEGAPQQMPGRRYISMDVQGENVETSVEDIFTTDAPAKVIENGQLIIIREGIKYNVQGVRL